MVSRRLLFLFCSSSRRRWSPPPIRLTLDSPSSSFGMDEERREFVVAPSRLGVMKDGRRILDAKTAMALKSHSEAKRRRRERINGHLVVLRRMVPCTNKYLKEASWAEGGRVIACTQPRRLAVQSVASRVAEEIGVKIGEEVGYTIQFEDQTNPGVTMIKFLTDGVLIREMMDDPLLTKYR